MSRHEQAVARATEARRRARRAHERAADRLRRGEVYLARVEANLARAEELVAANAELLMARQSAGTTVRVSAADRVFALRSAERRALEFAAIHRGRGQVSRAQFHEAAAEWLAFVAEANEEHGTSDLARQTKASLAAKSNGRVGRPATAEVGAA